MTPDTTPIATSESKMLLTGYGSNLTEIRYLDERLGIDRTDNRWPGENGVGVTSLADPALPLGKTESEIRAMMQQVNRIGGDCR